MQDFTLSSACWVTTFLCSVVCISK